MGSQKQREAKRTRFFQRGVEAYQRLASDTAELYRCPICLTLFPRDAVTKRDLTLEHVPPKSIGGREICLTCKACNSLGGGSGDFAFAEWKRLEEFATAYNGKGESTEMVGLTAGGIRLNVFVDVRDGQMHFRGDNRINAPTKRDAQREHFRRQREAGKRLEFKLDLPFLPEGRALFLAQLRTAYLAAFCTIGYRYAMDDNLSVVRHQLLNPDESLVPDDALFIPKPGAAPAEAMVTHAKQPVRCVGVYFGHSIVILPDVNERNPDFYSKLAELDDSDGAIPMVFNSMGWPSGMDLKYDFD